MKILHVATGIPIQFQGGIQNYVRSLAISQKENGNEVSILTEKGSTFNDTNINILTINTKKLVNALYGRMIDDNQYNSFKSFFDYNKFDIIHIHLTLGMDWRILDELEKCPYVVSLHDYNFICPRFQLINKKNELCEKYDEKKCLKCISWHERHRALRGCVKTIARIIPSVKYIHINQKVTIERYEINKRFLENANLLLPVSQRVKEIYKKSGINNEYKVLHIGNITAENFYKLKNNLKSESEKIIVAMIGTLSISKGADLFIKIASLCTNENIKFKFYGKSGEYASKLLKVNIEDCGKYNQAELNYILSDVDLGLVLPIWEDNAPQVVMEFLNNKIPVIGTSMGGIPDFINKENGILFNPYNSKEVDDVIKIMNSIGHEDINKMKNGIKPTLTPAEHERDVFEVYNNMLG